MNRKNIFRLVIMTLLVMSFLLPSPAIAQECEPYYISPISDYTADGVKACQDVIMFWGWIAIAPGLVREFTNVAQDTYTLKDSNGVIVGIVNPDEAEQYWTQPYAIDPIIYGLDAPMPKMWEADWEFSLGRLQPGTYTLHRITVLTHPVNDGTHVVIDLATGEKFLPLPGLYRGLLSDTTVTIVVTE